jgi:hypothetical protein
MPRDKNLFSVALTKMAVGFGATPLFSAFRSPRTGALHFVAYTSTDGADMRYRNLTVRQWLDETPIDHSTARDLSHGFLKALGAIHTPVNSDFDDLVRIATIYPPDSLSAHERMSAIEGARAFLVGAGFDPDQTDLIYPLPPLKFMGDLR